MIKFIEETHQYLLGDKELISVTTLMKKHGLSPNYAGVSSDVLKAKAERGTLIHKEIEDFIKSGELGFTTELMNFIKARQQLKDRLEIMESEFIVHNDIVAGTLDLLLRGDYGEYTVADIKTTASLHKEAISWQLSIYAYLLYSMDQVTIATKGQAYHFDKDGNLNIVDIPLKPFSEVERLLECERKGETFKQELSGRDADLMKLYEVEALIKSIEDQKQAAEEQAKELRAALMQAMDDNGLTTFENDRIKLTIKAPYERSSIDSARLKKEMPQIAEQYTKKSTVKASLVITLKEAQ